MNTVPDGSAAPALGGTPKRRVIPDPPEMDQGGGRRTLWFLLVLALAAAVAMAAVGTLNTLADPYGSMGLHYLPTVTTSDRTVKADAIEELKQPPQLIVLGSSRSMRYEPAYLKKKTGLRAFNAGVNGIGGTADAWAMSNFIDEVWPAAAPRYLWLLDVESFVPFKIQGSTATEPRLAKFVGRAVATEDVGGLAGAIRQNRTTLFSLATAWDSIRLIVNRDEASSKQSRFQRLIQPDGVLEMRPWSEAGWKVRFPGSVKRYGNLYRNAFKRLDPESERYFEKTLAFMNHRGIRPVVVLTPINPKLRAIVGPLGWDRRHREVVAYVTSLEGTYDLVFLDLTDPAVFGFDPVQFYDGVHPTELNTRRAIDYVLAQTGGFAD